MLFRFKVSHGIRHEYNQVVCVKIGEKKVVKQACVKGVDSREISRKVSQV